MERHLLVAEFIEEIRERADRRGMHLHHAFVDWYVEAEFGRATEWQFTDDVSDGGIDAIVWRNGETPPVVIIQSKFTKNVGMSKLHERAYNEFWGVVDAFHWTETHWDP